MEKQRVILIGHGGISKAYVKAFSTTTEAEIVGVVGRDEQRVKAYAKEQQIDVFGTKIEQVAKQSGATAAVICTPNAKHDEGVLTAAKLGLHCLCEKPLHISPERQLEMVNLCKQNGVILAVSYMRRFITHLLYIKDLIEAGKLGRIMVVDVTIKHFRDKQYYQSWHGTTELDGGGPFIQQGSHIVDLAQWLCGGYLEVLEAKRFQVYHEIETEDHGYAIIQYRNGAVGMIEASTASIGLNNEGIEISGTKGTIAANYQGITTFDVEGMECPAFDETLSTNERLFEKLVIDFIRSIHFKNPPFVDGSAAMVATQLVTDIYKKSGEPIRLLP
ncbi:Gfo/Idh/MocA family protein [Halalkalibacter urbisdiaboli]|uniref:Gfo/Idh/MocA family protein n=1 Tax=Halalkalibacter urbisdiaboli TaxID=1960589 RepID=UPI000B44F7F1|nr:Gfo/Idh/MocA family oxidoreductase [Halalkalibacter urbisdiaboli]